jgi:hypothetical protein
MVFFLRSIAALLRSKRPTLGIALRKSGFRPAGTSRINVRERRNREALLRRGRN